jgi:Mg2+ and Co2+ transporter CorA
MDNKTIIYLNKILQIFIVGLFQLPFIFPEQTEPYENFIYILVGVMIIVYLFIPSSWEMKKEN